MFHLFRKGKTEEAAHGEITREALLQGQVPRHVAVIMDGNGRWAKQRGLPRIAGHHSGMKAVKRATIAADDLGVKVLTMYAFSTENWTRPQEEVDFLMKLPQEFLSIELDELVEKNVQVRMTGIREGLPAHTLAALEEAETRTRNNSGLILNFALNYGGRSEMLIAVREVAERVRSGALPVEEIQEDTIQSCLLTSDLPDPDLLIRTSGELRLSNFMLWQMAYTELYFSPLYWPDFGEKQFFEAVHEFQRRSRRYGGL
ncbi:isoprenyl transferase [Paenibacillus sp. YN15]|uniref:isoprenyl transferase n=1 Tax=Paenibacillus sp. YN15 TaxID=1742774 RepID=UPI000DCC3633|nr:isoprenyl transferase [Paenibacillus sp. YN15]RAV03543.1 isoprenyl transferase [Paenibacillus sp. YN15]